MLNILAAVVDAAVNVLGNLIGKPNQTLVPVLTPSKRYVVDEIGVPLPRYERSHAKHTHTHTHT